MTLPLAGAKILAADLATVFPVGTDAWASFIPTLVQGATPTKTTNYANYMKIGRLVIANYALTVTGTGTASNVVVIGLPVAASSALRIGIGSGMIFDSSTGLFWNGHAAINNTTSFVISSYNAVNYLGGAGFTAALAVGDIIAASVMYEAAS